VAAPCRSLSVPLAKPFVRPCKLLRRCSRYCSSRGAKLLPAAAEAEGHDTANPFFRPRRGAPVVSAPTCRLLTDRCGECARATVRVPLCTVSMRALGSHRRSIACAALRSLAGASGRRARNIRRRSKCIARAARRSAGLHSHAATLKPDGGRSGGVSRPQAATATRRALGQPEVHQ